MLQGFEHERLEFSDRIPKTRTNFVVLQQINFEKKRCEENSFFFLILA